jgi:hypothetical protein
VDRESESGPDLVDQVEPSFARRGLCRKPCPNCLSRSLEPVGKDERFAEPCGTDLVEVAYVDEVEAVEEPETFEERMLGIACVEPVQFVQRALDRQRADGERSRGAAEARVSLEDEDATALACVERTCEEAAEAGADDDRVEISLDRSTLPASMGVLQRPKWALRYEWRSMNASTRSQASSDASANAS